MWTRTTLQCQFLMVIQSGISIMCLEHISKNNYLWPREWRKGLSSRCFEQDLKRQIGFWHMSCWKWIVGVRIVWGGSIDIWTYNCFQNVEESSAADEKDKTAKVGWSQNQSLSSAILKQFRIHVMGIGRHPWEDFIMEMGLLCLSPAIITLTLSQNIDYKG